jgi:hypothetical protein
MEATMEPRMQPKGSGWMNLVAGILDDFRSLMRQEVQLLRDEILLEMSKAGRAASGFGAGVLLAAIGLLFLLLMLVHGLHEWTGLPLWASYGVIGIVLAGIGLSLVAKARSLAGRVGPRRGGVRPFSSTHGESTLEGRVKDRSPESGTSVEESGRHPKAGDGISETWEQLAAVWEELTAESARERALLQDTALHIGRSFVRDMTRILAQSLIDQLSGSSRSGRRVRPQKIA